MPFEIVYQKNLNAEGGLEYRLNGSITSYNLKDLRNDIEKEIEEKRAGYFIFDFKDVNYIDSQGISLLVMAGKYNSASGRKMLLKNVAGVVKGILITADLNFVEFA